MYQRKYFTLNIFINEIFSVEKFPNYGIKFCEQDAHMTDLLVQGLLGLTCPNNLSTI